MRFGAAAAQVGGLAQGLRAVGKKVWGVNRGSLGMQGVWKEGAVQAQKVWIRVLVLWWLMRLAVLVLMPLVSPACVAAAEGARGCVWRA